MAKGKYAARATNRRDIDALEQQAARAQRLQIKAEQERDAAVTALADARARWAIERRDLIADRDQAVSPRLVEMGDLLLRRAEQNTDLAQKYNQAERRMNILFRWIVKHMREVHQWKDEETPLLLKEINSAIGLNDTSAFIDVEVERASRMITGGGQTRLTLGVS